MTEGRDILRMLRGTDSVDAEYGEGRARVLLWGGPGSPVAQWWLGYFLQ